MLWLDFTATTYLAGPAMRLLGTSSSFVICLQAYVLRKYRMGAFPGDKEVRKQEEKRRGNPGSSSVS